MGVKANIGGLSRRALKYGGVSIWSYNILLFGVYSFFISFWFVFLHVFMSFPCSFLAVAILLLFVVFVGLCLH